MEWWVETPRGDIIDGRPVDIRGPAGVRRVMSKGKTREPVSAGLLTVTDVESRVSAVVEVGP